MAKLEYKAECLCGGEIKIIFKKPTQMQPTIARTKCKGCRSHYMFSCQVKTNEKGRYYFTDHVIDHMTDKLKEVLKEKQSRQTRGATNEHNSNP